LSVALEFPFLIVLATGIPAGVYSIDVAEYIGGNSSGDLFLFNY
jgi:hypothetical protein